jgi:hypothetical protein
MALATGRLAAAALGVAKDDSVYEIQRTKAVVWTSELAE